MPRSNAKKPSPHELLKDPIRAAQEAGLYYTSQTELGYTRRNVGTDKKPQWTYVDHRDRARNAAKDLERINTLRIPPAWTAVWICADPAGHLQATGLDQKGRRQYIYHPLWTKLRAAAKFERMVPFGENLHRIRDRCTSDLRKRGLPKDKVVALVITLLDHTYIRIGNDEYARKNQSFGLTTLQDDHVEIVGGKAVFTFSGKSGKDHEIKFTDRRLVKMIKACRDIPGDDLFQYYDAATKRQDIKSNHINEYLLDTTSVGFTAKDFRTWGGTHLAATSLAVTEPESAESRRKRQLTATVKEIASTLGNTVAVCRSSYIHPRILDEYMDGVFVENWKKALRTRVDDALELDEDEVAVLSYLKS